MQSVVTTEVDQIQDVFLEAAASKSWACLEELGADPTVAAHRPGHILHIGAGHLAEGGDAVDRADSLGQKGIGREL